MEICAAQYFSTLNAIAAKVAADAEATVASFEHLWNTMDPREKASTLTDALIEPEVVLKYLRMNQMASAGVLEPEPPSGHDEHGAPFLWHTRSQLDLVNLAQASPCGALIGAPTKQPPARLGPQAKVSKPKAPPPPPPKARPQAPCNEKSHAIVVSGTPHDDTEALVVTEEEDDEPEERISAHSPATEEKSLLHEYSKADYDFLNNW